MYNIYASRYYLLSTGYIVYRPSVFFSVLLSTQRKDLVPTRLPDMDQGSRTCSLPYPHPVQRNISSHCHPSSPSSLSARLPHVVQ